MTVQPLCNVCSLSARRGFSNRMKTRVHFENGQSHALVFTASTALACSSLISVTGSAIAATPFARIVDYQDKIVCRYSHQR